MTSVPRAILGFDYGTKRIGVAVGHELTKTATGLTTIYSKANQIDWPAIDRLVNEWQPQAMVVGLPLNADGSEHAITQAAKQFGVQLQKRYNLDIFWQDERLTSHEAQRIMAASQKGNPKRSAQRRKQLAGDIDRTAAMLILESWLNQQIKTAKNVDQSGQPDK